MNLQFDKIKVIIWDLDDTLWSGTLSEGEISFPAERKSLLTKLCDGGIVNTICSKNDEAVTIAKLEELGISNLFVFNSINWEPKGQRIKTTLSKMGLRSANALFIDDNEQNLNEAEFYNPEIMTALPSVIVELAKFAEGLSSNKSRMEQYRILEKKSEDAKDFSSNEEFLRSSNIRLEIKRDCQSVIDRLYELVKRTNQLNYTKYRPDYTTFTQELSQADDAGYVKVCDNYGFYGIVGFFLIKNNKCVHFLFSCRTIGVGVEQYVYAKLDYPPLETVGSVIAELTHAAAPDWITESAVEEETANTSDSIMGKVLIKGPCDLSSAIGYLNLGDSVDCEFTFTDEGGHLVENHNHSAHVYANKVFTEGQKNLLIAENLFLDTQNFTTSIFSGNYKIIILSTLIEGMYGLYKRKGTGEIIAFGHYKYDLTDRTFWDGYINKTIQTYDYTFTREFLEKFASDYEYIGRTTPEMYIQYLDFLLYNIPQETKLCLILGSEIPYEAETDVSYLDRHEFHKSLNNAIKEYAKTHSQITCMELTKFIHSQADFTTSINHFQIYIYNQLAKELLAVIRQHCGDEIKVSYSLSKWIDRRYGVYWRNLRYNIGKLLPTCLLKVYRNIRYKN